ncbi:MAG: hypothetical protein KO206_02305 [Methanomicrobiaceae archaeon]|uniref:Nuclear transport factor 2 family protein n=1 Tax=hydrocarbon metagenome TaxID=938273 RepID=A0A0W8FKJ3_9ZZZZ|nr:hypothetical protein [Methanomicrobiaceae archaeon]MDD5419991.1 hypothetical protein [Methanomicrobiaceae archaeon]
MDLDARLSMTEEFFAAYAAGFNNALADPPEVDVEAAAGAFADCFIAADPNGVLCGKNDEQLRAQIPAGYAFYRSIGTKSMRVVSLTVTPLDDSHLITRVHREARYRKKGGSEEEIDFDVIYFVRTVGKQPRIFGYIPGDDQALLRERGLIPSPEET